MSLTTTHQNLIHFLTLWHSASLSVSWISLLHKQGKYLGTHLANPQFLTEMKEVAEPQGKHKPQPQPDHFPTGN